MRCTFVAIMTLLLYSATPCMAHRLDEYLQATKITIEQNQIGVDLRLTPGVAVLPTVLAAIDSNSDGLISDAEQRAYAQRVRDDLLLTFDGKPLSLQITSSSFPDAEPMKQGLGDIVLHFDATTPGGERDHTLVLENRHMPQVSIYLANCLVPTDPNIRVTAQSRNYNQTVYRIDYTQAGTSSGQSVAPSGPLESGHQSTSLSLFQGYVLHGIGHILTGYDHLLFISALVLAATSLWDLIKVVSAFTLAHTLTLTLAALGVVHVSERIVEPFIAASIVFVAVQNVFWPSRARGWSRLGAAFFFGLFHGLGFAGGLLEAMRELPPGTMFLAILAFSIGVETGHQMVVLPLFGFLKAARRTQSDPVMRTRLSMAFQRIGSAGISIAGAYYLCIALMPPS